MAIFRPKPSQIFFFGLVPMSPIHIGLIYVKTPKPNISCLGPFKGTLTNAFVSIYVVKKLLVHASPAALSRLDDRTQ
jgi:hypothetical protein